MSYVDENLLPDEEVLHHTYGHWVAFVKPTFALTASLGLWIAAYSGILEERLGVALPAQSHLVLLAIAGGCLLWVLVAVLWFYSTEVGLTNRRVLIKEGIIFRKTLELFVERIESVHVDQSILGRMLGYGTVKVVGTGETVGRLSTIPKPLALRRMVQEINARTRTGASAPAPRGAAPLPDRTPEPQRAEELAGESEAAPEGFEDIPTRSVR